VSLPDPPLSRRNVKRRLGRHMMSLGSRPFCAVATMLASGWFAAAASAAPLTYNVVQAESNTLFQAGALASMDVNPDFANAFPASVSMLGISNTAPGPLSKVAADVGLPGAFNPGTGITFTDLQIRQITPGTITGIGSLPVALDILGNTVSLVAVSANVSFFSIVLDAPFSSSLIPSGNPDEWLWAGLANVTLSGFFEPIVTIPTVPDVTLGQFPFSQQVTIPLTGTFASIPTGSEVTVGIAAGALEDQPLPLPLIQQTIPLDPLQLGIVTGSINFGTLILHELSAEAVFRNSTPIPEPAPALLVGLGLAGLALRARRRDR
jgi:hypothetical protein